MELTSNCGLISKPLQVAVRFGARRTYPDCYYIGICDILDTPGDDSDEEPSWSLSNRCQSARALLRAADGILTARFLRRTVSACAFNRQFASGRFPVPEGYALRPRLAAKLGLPLGRVWEIPPGNYPVEPSEEQLTVRFPLMGNELSDGESRLMVLPEAEPVWG